MSARRVIATLIVFVTGVVVGPLLFPASDFPRANTALDRANLATATAFYGAANLFLKSGDDAPLLEALDPAFIDHSQLGVDSTAAGLMRYLGSMRKTYPDMRLEAGAIAARDDVVTVSLATTRATTTIAGGLVADRAASVPAIEQLRIQNGKVAERWASGILPP